MMIRRGMPSAGLLLCLLALVVQLAFGAVVPNPASALVLAAAEDICHAPAAPDGAPSPIPHHHQAPDCQFCPLCSALAAPGLVLPGGVPLLPSPWLVAARRPEMPPPQTAPPITLRIAPQPRGPPILT